MKTQLIYPIGISENWIIKDRAKHTKQQTTSSRIKSFRDLQSSVECLPGSPSTKRKEEKELLKYNMKSKDLIWK